MSRNSELLWPCWKGVNQRCCRNGKTHRGGDCGLPLNHRNSSVILDRWLPNTEECVKKAVRSQCHVSDVTMQEGVAHPKPVINREGPRLDAMPSGGSCRPTYFSMSL
jgi:hypothetical protein